MNGPEVLSKFVGETEKNVRDLFADAENDQRTRGKRNVLAKWSCGCPFLCIMLFMSGFR